VTAGILAHKISDHQPYFITLPLKLNRIEPKPELKIRKITTNAIEQVGQAILDFNVPDDAANNDPNISYNALATVLTESLNKYMPIRTVKFKKQKHKGSPWITDAIIKSIRTRDKTWKDLKKTQLSSARYDALKLSLQIQNKILQRTIRAAKLSYYQSCFNNLKDNMKKTWQLIDSLLQRKKSKSTSPKSLTVNNITYTDKSDIATKFNSYFTKIGENLASEINYEGPLNPIDMLGDYPHSQFNFEAISEDSVNKIIMSLKGTSSVGYDTISTKLVKTLRPYLVCPLTRIVNQCLHSGTFPNALKIAKVIPIHKKGDTSNFNNYRPISLLPAISKIFEKVMYQQLHQYFSQSNLFYDAQYGFRSRFSTKIAALQLVDQLTTDMDANKIKIVY
jgi:potassium voltage-gated channel Eag-related subfamily H protein 8